MQKSTYGCLNVFCSCWFDYIPHGKKKQTSANGSQITVIRQIKSQKIKACSILITIQGSALSHSPSSHLSVIRQN